MGIKLRNKNQVKIEWLKKICIEYTSKSIYINIQQNKILIEKEDVEVF